MQREQIDFSGKLNKDDALPPKGDYRDAKNIIKSTSLTGGGNSIKKLPSITEFASISPADIGVFVCSTVGDDNSIYAIEKKNITDAELIRIDNTGVVSQIMRYPHGSCGITPTIVKLGNVVIWNYSKENGIDGIVLSWDISRYSGGVDIVSDYNDLYFAKPIPMTLSATPNTLGGAENEFRNTKWDFACQYVYDSGEVSALSDFLTVFPEEDKSTTHYGLDGIGSVTLNADTTHPTYATELIYYARANDGVWRRVTTITDIGTSTSFDFKGVLNEALPTEVSSKPFDSVPISAETIEVIANRVFLGNIQDDLGGGSIDATITLTPDSDELDSGAAGGDLDNPLSYLKVASGTNAVSEGVVDTVADNNPNNLVRERLANDSTYFIGYQFHDLQGRTRGVESFSEFNTGMFTFPTRLSEFKVSIPTASIPAWASYIQPVISNNRKKDFFVESYGTGKGYEILNADGSTRLANFAADADNIESIVISTLVKYTFQKGDLINLQVSPMSSSREYKTLRVKGYADGLLYIEPSEDLNADLFQSTEYLHFEIYSPADRGEDPIFRATGDVRAISTLTINGANSELTISNPSGMIDCFMMKQKISPKTNIVSSQWTTMAWKKEGTSDEYTIFNNGIPADIGNTNRFTKIEENTDRATINLSGGNGITLNPPTVFEGSTDEELDAYTLEKILTGTVQYSDTGADIEVTGLTLTAGAVVGNFDLEWDLKVQEPNGTAWNSSSIQLELRVGSSFATADVVESFTVYQQGQQNTSTIAGNSTINIASGDKVFLAIIDDANSNSVWINHSSSLTATPTEAALSDTNSRAGDYLIHARVNIGTADIAGTPAFTLQVAVDGTPTYTIIQDEPLLNCKRSYDAIFDHSAVGNQKLSLLVTLSVGDQGSGTRSFKIGNGTSLSAVLKEDRELYNVSIENNGDPLYYLARRSSKVDSVVEWRKPAGKPSLSYEDKPISDLSNKFRWGDKYVFNAKTNPISSFYFADQDEVPAEGGGISALVRTSNMNEEGTVLLAICERETFSIYVQESILRDVGGSSQLIASDKVIGSIQPLKGSYGTSHRRSISSFAGRVVYWDNRRKDWIRYSSEGLVPLGDVYKMKSVFDDKDGDAVSFYDPFHDVFMMGFIGDTSMYIFQNRFGFVSELEIDLSSGTFINGGVIDNKAVIFREDQCYLSNGSGYGSYVGSTVTEASIKLPVISATPICPLALSLRSRQWILSDFTTTSNYIKAGVFSVVVTNENNQQTTMPSTYFRVDSGMMYADVYKDENSGVSEPKINGFDLQGLFHEIQIKMSDLTIDDQLEDILLDYQILSGR